MDVFERCDWFQSQTTANPGHVLARQFLRGTTASEVRIEVYHPVSARMARIRPRRLRPERERVILFRQGKISRLRNVYRAATAKFNTGPNKPPARGAKMATRLPPSSKAANSRESGAAS